MFFFARSCVMVVLAILKIIWIYSKSYYIFLVGHSVYCDLNLKNGYNCIYYYDFDWFALVNLKKHHGTRLRQPRLLLCNIQVCIFRSRTLPIRYTRIPFVSVSPKIMDFPQRACFLYPVTRNRTGERKGNSVDTDIGLNCFGLFAMPTCI